MNTGVVLAGYYDYRLVALSVFISILASYATLDLAERITTVRGWIRHVWLSIGAMAMGIGIWAMHYVGMVALQLPVQVAYHWPTVLLSLCTAVAASGVALLLVSRPTMSSARTFAGSVIMGSGIAAMHYIGMAAMRMPASCIYSPAIVALSVVLAIAISFAALRITFTRREIRAPLDARKVEGALLMGLAIPIMHYVGMTAVTFRAQPAINAVWPRAYPIGHFGLAAISAGTIIFLGHICLVSSVERRFLRQNERLRQNQLELQTIFDSASTAIAVMDQRRDQLRLNRAAAEMLGLKEHRFNFQRAAELFSSIQFLHPSGELMPLQQRPGYMALHGQFVQNLEVCILKRETGERLICEIDTAPVPGLNGKTAQVLLVCRDITARKRTEHAQAQLAAIVQSSEDAIVGKDLDGIVTSWNRGAERIFGYTAAEMVGQPIRRIIPPDRQGEEDDILASIRNGETVAHSETVRRKKNGETVYISVTISPIRNDRGQIVGASKIARDITERKRIEDAQAQLVAIIESSEDAIIGKDLNGLVTSWNKGAEKIFGYAAEEMIGHSVFRLMPPGREGEEDEILARIRRGETIAHTETIRRRKSGELIHVSVTISPIRNRHGDIIGASKIARDITARKHLERQLYQSQKMDALGQLTGGIAHDFNNMLGVVVGNLDLLERLVAADAPALDRVRKAQKAALRGADLTRRLRAFSSREELHPTPVSIPAVIQEIAEMAIRTVGPEIRVTHHWEEPIPPVVVDPGGLESALLNLVVNARDAMPKGGKLTFNARAVDLGEDYALVQTGELSPGKYVSISVSDSGHGMSRETLERAFEPFFTTKPREKGTGLGLAMVYGFMRQSGGAVRLYSEKDFGTTVNLYLPLAPSHLLTIHPAPAAESGEKRGGTVLLVDDEEMLLEIAEDYLREIGYRVLRAEEASSALEVLAHAAEVDLLVTDIFMPGAMNGIELAEKVRELRPGIRVIFTSGFPAEALTERSGKLVDGPLLHKPYTRASFIELVRKTMSENLQFGRYGNNGGSAPAHASPEEDAAP